MLTYSFYNIGSDSLYEHLYKCIRTDIMNGTLASGYKLPSKRSLAKHLDISVITVENAYAQLLAEGYIYSIPKKGYYVEQPPQSGWWSGAFEKNEDMQKQYIYNMKNVDGSSREMVLDEVGDTYKDSALYGTDVVSKEAGRTYLADFLNNHTRPENFPFSTWAKLMREVLNEEHASLMLPPPSGGIMQLRCAIARHLLQFRGMHVQPEQIIIGAGTEYLYELLIKLLGREKVFGVEEPGYRKIAQIYESNGVACRFIAMDESGMDAAVLKQSDVDVIHISPSHHYPTGIVTPIGRRYELLGWASDEDGRYIIEDDYDCEFRLQGKPIPALQSIDVMDKVIYMNTFTKSLASTIRISYMVLPYSLLKKFYETLGFYACTVSNFEQYTLARFIEEGYFEKHINRMRSYYRALRNQLITAIKKSSLANAVICEEEAGLHFLLKIQSKYHDIQLQQRANAAGIRLNCLSQFYHQPEAATQQDTALYENVLVINYSGMDPADIEEAVKQLVVVVS